MKPPEFHASQRFEREYERAIKRLVSYILPKPGEVPVNNLLATVARNSQSYAVAEASQTLAHRMVTWANVRNARTWREAAARAQKSRKLHALLMQEMQGPVGSIFSRLVRENARLISSIPIEAADTLSRELTKAVQQGSRPETIAKMASNRFPHLLRSRVRLIARTESQKASAALTQARATYLNLPCYIWRTSEDARVRDSHRLMDGVICFYAQPPSPEAINGERSNLGHYQAGECPNCRCTQIVVLALEDLKFPVRVVQGNSIVRMNKTQFAAIAGQLAA
jgi:SPP1 gp7 family putative phage head morphogenesis protein